MLVNKLLPFKIILGLAVALETLWEKAAEALMLGIIH